MPVPAAPLGSEPVPERCDLAVLGHVVTHQVDLPRGEVLIHQGVVQRLSEGPSGIACSRMIDVGESLVLPGAMDVHVHSLSYPGEGIAAATASAAAGGVTTIVEMPFDAGAPVWTLERLEAKKELAAREALVDLVLCATIRPGGGLSEAPAMIEAGAGCFKLSTFNTDPERFPRTPDDELLQVFSLMAETGVRVCMHAESDEIVRALLARYSQEADQPRLHAATHPPISETLAVAGLLELARETGAPLHLCHLSLPHSFELVTRYKAEGLPVTGETCPHYLVFSEPDLERLGARVKINPPPRAEDEVEALWAGLSAGQVDMISSDHAPWPPEYKTRPRIFDNASGAPGVETLVPVTLSEGYFRRGLPLQLLVDLLSHRPAVSFGLGHRKGDLRPGMDADIMVIEPQAYRLEESELHSTAAWSPYQGMELRGRVALTLSRGEVVWDGENLTDERGRGEVLRPRRVT